MSALPQTNTDAATPSEALRARDLTVLTLDGDALIEEVSLRVGRGEILGIVGESGSGKTTTALTLLGFASGGARITSGEIEVGAIRVAAADAAAITPLRGASVAYVPQNPGTALNPALRVGAAIADMVEAHAAAAAGTPRSALERVGLPATKAFARRFPHQLSGGQQQRVCIAIASVNEPPVILLDEPTTGLDVVTQAKILDELRRLRDEEEVAMIYVSHDLGVVAGLADRVAVMYAGRIVEEGPTREVLAAPRHPYTRGLLSSIPDHARPVRLQPLPGAAVAVGERPDGCAFAPRCSLRTEDCVRAIPPLRELGGGRVARCLHAEKVDPVALKRLDLDRRAHVDGEPVLTVERLVVEHRGRHETTVAAADVSFVLRPRECVALVGESGSGKTTIARAVVGLHPPSGGALALAGEPLAGQAKRRTAQQRRRIQLIFQNPVEALNPRHTVGATLAHVVRQLHGAPAGEATAEVGRLLQLVKLPERIRSRYPSELSGGEAQRVGIARALAARPDVIVCDEITSALDVSVQAAILALLEELRAELGLALLFITHDLGVVASIADRVLVLERGLVCEEGPVGALLRTPRHAYTRRLVESAPSVSEVLSGTPSAHRLTKGTA